MSEPKRYRWVIEFLHCTQVESDSNDAAEVSEEAYQDFLDQLKSGSFPEFGIHPIECEDQETKETHCY